MRCWFGVRIYIKVRDSEMPEILLVADDLTGALDSAVAFAGGGRTVRLARGVEQIGTALSPEPTVLAINTASREQSEDVARTRMEAAAAVVTMSDVPLVVKKVDSRLKGHVAVETSTLARLAGRIRVVAVPAIPDMARVQSAGWLTGEGVDGRIDIVQRFGGGVVAPDVATNSDLDTVVAGSPSEETLWAGARGLAFALARARFGGARLPAPDLPHPFVFAIGSRDPITLAQVKHLGGAVEVVSAPGGDVPEIDRAADLYAIVIAEGVETRSPAQAGRAFAEGAVRALESLRPRTLLACGGETADAILGRLGIGTLDVLAEVAPGLPVCRAKAPWGEIMIVTKSGGFGSPDLLNGLTTRDNPQPSSERDRA